MSGLWLMVFTFVGYLVAYHTYGKFLARKIFRLDDSRLAPSHALADGVDYVPTRKGIIFGHHFTSIAGTGPIVGPAIGVIWGWVPALIYAYVASAPRPGGCVTGGPGRGGEPPSGRTNKFVRGTDPSLTSQL